jgi:hypothetical protein
MESKSLISRIGLTTSLACLTQLGCFSPSICVPPPAPAGGCVQFAATSEPTSFTLSITTECHIVDEDVTLTQQRTGATVVLRVGTDGSSPPSEAVTVQSGDAFAGVFGDSSCQRGICTVFIGAGPGGDCDL